MDNTTYLASRCCGTQPALRIRPKTVAGMRIQFLRFECGECQRIGGLAITEEEALAFWEFGARSVAGQLGS